MYTIMIMAPESSETEWTFQKQGDARRFLKSLGFKEKKGSIWYKPFPRGSSREVVPVECKIVKVKNDQTDKN